MAINNYLHQIGELVGKDDLPQAIALLQKVLQNSPKLDEAIIHSARYNDISKQIRMGTVDFSQANITKNQIRLGILQLVGEIEETVGKSPQIEQEASNYVKQWQAENAIVQTHSGTGDNVGGNKITHGGRGDVVTGDKTTWVSVPIRWTLVAGLFAALLGCYLILWRPDKKPIPNFTYRTEGAKNNVSIAGKPVVFEDKSEGAASIRWTFPNGETYTDKKVTWYFKYQGTYEVKLQAFSRKGEMEEKIVKCVINATDNPDDAIQIKVVFEHDKSVDMTGMPSLEIGCIKPTWGNDKTRSDWTVMKGEQPYFISGHAFSRNRQGNVDHCEVHGSGRIVFEDKTIYRIFYTNKNSCEVTMEKAPIGYRPPL